RRGVLVAHKRTDVDIEDADRCGDGECRIRLILNRAHVDGPHADEIALTDGVQRRIDTPKVVAVVRFVVRDQRPYGRATECWYRADINRDIAPETGGAPANLEARFLRYRLTAVWIGHQHVLRGAPRSLRRITVSADVDVAAV